MLYVQLDVNWPDHHPAGLHSLEATGLYLAIVCRSARGTPTSREELEVERPLPAGLIEDLLALGVLRERAGRLEPVDPPDVRGMHRRWIPVHVRRQVMERDGFACRVCSASEDLSLDHIIPYSHGGPDTVENLRVLCRPCNSRRGNRV